MEAKASAHLIISGRVQGVFFRAETQRAARLYGVTGWVRNLSDGTVEAVAQGNKDDVLALIEWCRKGPPLSRVDNVAVRWQDDPANGNTFDIRY